MNKDDIIRMAQKAGFDKWDSTCLSGKSDLDEKLAVGEYATGEAVFKFATLVAAAEREACLEDVRTVGGAFAVECEKLIRARGQG